MSSELKPSVHIKKIETDFAVQALDNMAWSGSQVVTVDQYWSGENAPNGRHFAVRLLWSTTSLYLRFDANQHEPLIVSDKPDRTRKAMGLWDRDVCEVFIAPERREPGKYYEFEAAPTGEWLDVALEASGGARISDWNYTSGLESFARVEPGKVVIVIKIPWTAFEKAPNTGDVWFGNLFRCVGSDPNRGYLAWSPTMTETPEFHIPERFGEFVFVG